MTTTESFSQKVKELRAKNGMSQEELAEESGLNLRTVQRVENGESVPRGDTLKRLAIALKVSASDILEIQVVKDKNVLLMLNISQLGYLFFPLLGLILPLIIWIMKKETIEHVNRLGVSIMNFQLTWAIATFSYMYFCIFVNGSFSTSFPSVFMFLYLYNAFIIVYNFICIKKGKKTFYQPAIPFLRK